MGNENTTTRDKEYLRALFVLKAHEEPVGPTELARCIDVSRVGALQKMRKLEFLGYGKYIPKKGLRLNEKALALVQKDVKRHHMVEKFLEDTLDMNSDEACDESSALDPHISEKFIKQLDKKLGDDLECQCGCCIEPYYDPEDLYNCHWYRKKFTLP